MPRRRAAAAKLTHNINKQGDVVQVKRSFFGVLSITSSRALLRFLDV